MKYSVTVPPPSAKRMAANGKVVLTLHDGWYGDELVSHDGPNLVDLPLEEGSSKFEFEVDDQYEWAYSTQVTDGWSFRVHVEYSNSTGTRKETKQLVPEKI